MLIQAAGTLRDISSSSCAVIVTLLQDLCRKAQSPTTQTPTSTSTTPLPPQHSQPPSQTTTRSPSQPSQRETPPPPPSLEASLAPLRPLWVPPLATLLCSNDMKTRVNVADYLVPELMKVSTHPVYTPYQHTLSTHPINTPLSTHPELMKVL